MFESRWQRKHFQSGWIAAIGLALTLGSSFGLSAEPMANTDVLAHTIQTRCVKCHGADPEDLSGDVDLRSFTTKGHESDAELLRQIIEAIEFGAMPPEDEAPLEDDLSLKLIGELNTRLHNAVAKEESLPHVPMRRMNRFQYNNAVVDLFDLNCVVFSLPERMMRDHSGYFQPQTGQMPKVVSVGSRPMGKSQMIEPRLAGVVVIPQDLRAEHGFDNRGDHLTLSPLLMQEFLKLGKSIVESPDFTPRRVGIWKAFFAPPDANQNVKEEARRRLEIFLTRAFRRPVEPEVLDRYSQFIARQLDAEVAFPEAMKSAAAAVISSPKFLYLYDQKSEGAESTSLDDFELASRLSFFLWGSIPDQKLLSLAAAGQLSSPEVLDQQIERMLKDGKMKRFTDSFPTQWLQLERIISSVPDPERYPNFYFSRYRDSMHMMLEPLLIFETVLIENQPIRQLIDSDFTYRSRLLEDAYGKLASPDAAKRVRGNDVTVLKFERVPITDRRNGGMITNAAIMTMTSGPQRTQPITRGAWIAAVIFNNPPKPPPADVPPLAEKPQEGEENLTLRERLALHRERSDCRGCHEQIDPLGFALENYSPIGTWREKYDNGREVDVSGKLFGKHQFTDIIEFKDAILDEEPRFARALAGHLLSFSLARELVPSDEIALDTIVANAQADDFKMQTMLKQVILSRPFLAKRSPDKSNPTQLSQKVSP
ncbi:DUF1592 domain-containing protein [Bremerella sp. P1]|uniref:DUF1592 domain-containing protein n=1 Tax=Bremerella sp. P1 TaxID=3026424 RepID=UPI002367BB6D|nr:DUF1592 domain-containing protein [Bremerella sp. P1]WDI42207.1 DUF1592 domain-containing protein [Bremerella sp. P1]